MSRAPCDRVWQAEALEDGRLCATERASFERHASGCADCQAEQRAIALLRERIADLADREPSPLEQRRRRAELLRAANQSVVGASRSRWPLRVGTALLLFAIPAAAAARWFAPWRTPSAMLHVPRVASASTSAYARSGADSRVSACPNAPVEGPASVPARPVVVAEHAADQHSLGPRIPRIASMSSESPIAAPVASSSASIMQDERDAIAALYASGVTAFQAGDYAGAERQLRRFAARAPADSRGEDAAFLIALARARRGDSVGAASSAREYLHRFPHGLRRREAEQLVSPAGSN